MLDNLLSQKQLSLIWTGNNGFIIHGEEKLVAFDLDIYNHERISPCTLDLKLLAEQLDILMITHAHEDHMNTQTIDMLISNSNCHFVIPASCDYSRIPKSRLTVVQPNEIHIICGIKIETIRAIHGHIGGSVYSGASLQDCGYIITIDDKRIYQPGDSLLLEEQSKIIDIDLLFLSTTEHNTHIEHSLTLIDWIKPKLVIPQHHSTYVEVSDNLFWSHGYVDEVYARMENKDIFKKISQETVYIILSTD